jgi:hypothetical protein
MYPVDGATIAPNMDERGGYHDDAYVQVVDGQITARFGMEDLICDHRRVEGRVDPVARDEQRHGVHGLPGMAVEEGLRELSDHAEGNGVHRGREPFDGEGEDSAEQEKGIVPLLTLIADYFEVEVIGEHGLGVGDYVEFKWDEEGESEGAILNRFSVMIPMGASSSSTTITSMPHTPRASESQLVPLAPFAAASSPNAITSLLVGRVRPNVRSFNASRATLCTWPPFSGPW